MLLESRVLPVYKADNLNFIFSNYVEGADQYVLQLIVTFYLTFLIRVAARPLLQKSELFLQD
jgi:hypothetical protein